MSTLQIIENPTAALCGDSAEDFLRNLGAPSALFLPGADAGRCRAFVTLLHGNEPSGLLALRRWLTEGRQPAVNVLAIVASVATALTPPLLSHRMLPGTRDLNRCFRPPFADAPGQLAQGILHLLDAHAPEAIVDMHNTSGSGPAFGVVNHADPQHDALIALFTRRLIVSGLQLGALMELSTPQRPVVTAEVGGRADARAHQVAWEGLERYLLADSVLRTPAPGSVELEVLRHPIRVELREGVALGYGELPRPDCDITLRLDIERYNFGTVDDSICLGWTDADPRDVFRAVDSDGRCAVSTLLQARGGRLMPARPMKLFMITGNAEIARADCLCYAVADDGGPLRSAA